MSIVEPAPPFVGQDKSMACWLAAAAMLRSWKDSTSYDLLQTIQLSGNKRFREQFYDPNVPCPPDDYDEFCTLLGLRFEPRNFSVEEMMGLVDTHQVVAFITAPVSGADITHALVAYGHYPDDTTNTDRFLYHDSYKSDGQSLDATVEEFHTLYENGGTGAVHL